MTHEIRYEPTSKRFTFDDVVDGKPTQSVRPQRYSPQDKWGSYRRKGLEAQRKEKGVLTAKKN